MRKPSRKYFRKIKSRKMNAIRKIRRAEKKKPACVNINNSSHNYYMSDEFLRGSKSEPSIVAMIMLILTIIGIFVAWYLFLKPVMR